MQIYDQDSRPLAEILRDASSEQGATLLVPDLQRPYVWTPNQVTLLVDSLLRGWPFGTLLLWAVKKDDLASIPSRPFWRVVDRTNEDLDAQQVSKSNPPAEFRMVLDGQQRVQSLLLAFGGDGWGFRLLDHEWSTTLEAERPKGKYAKRHWSLAHLSLDLVRYLEAIRLDPELSRLEFRDVLQWTVSAPTGGRSTLKRPANYKYPVLSALDQPNHGRFIRLSRLWAIAASSAKTLSRHYRADVQALLAAHEVPDEIATGVTEALSELVVALRRVQDEKVSYLLLRPFNERDFTQDVYNDAIVNIFTRLNTAGRVLTRQEITFAWIKTGWDPSKTESKTAGQCFEELNEALAAAHVPLDIDALVGAISAMWSVIHREGGLLTATDLLRGEKVRPMAQDLVGDWGTIASNVTDGARLVADRGFQFGVHYRSLNVLTLLLCWRLLGRSWLARHVLDVRAKDSFEKSLDGEFVTICDRWILLSQWSGRWGKSTDKAFADYVRDLAADWSTIRQENAADNVLSTLKQRMTGWIDALGTESSKYIEDLGVLTRDAVHQYHLPLWLWHRLDDARWKASSVQLRDSKRGSVSIDVDHVVAVKLWESLPGSSPSSAVVEDDEQALAEDDLSTKMNALGNCCLLEKTFNIAKGAEPLEKFLGRVHEFMTGSLKVATWALDIGLDPELVNPMGKTVADVRTVVEQRTARMKAELKEYIAGTRKRADL